MIIDKGNQFASAQVVTVTAPSTDVIDQGANQDAGVGGKLQVLVQVDTAFTAAGAATMQIQLQCDSDSAFGTVKTVIETDAIPVATLIAGYRAILPIPYYLDKRYIRVNYVIATGPMLTGAISAAVVMGVQHNPAYADALVP